MKFWSNFKKVISWIWDHLVNITTLDTRERKVITICIYLVMFLNTAYLLLPFLEIQGLTTGSGRVITFSAPDGEDLKVYTSHLYDISLIVFMVFASGSLSVLFVVLAAIKGGVKIDVALGALHGIVGNKLSEPDKPVEEPLSEEAKVTHADNDPNYEFRGEKE